MPDTKKRNRGIVAFAEIRITRTLKMESIKRLFKAESEDENVPLLSEIIAQTGGYLLPDRIDALFDYSKEIQAKGALKTDEDEEWLMDFVTNVRSILVLDKKLDDQVAQRVAGATMPPVARTGAGSNTAENEVVGNRHGVSSFRSPSGIEADRSPQRTTSMTADIWSQRPSSQERPPRPLPSIP